jgi:low temperature requirement protein LtrA
MWLPAPIYKRAPQLWFLLGLLFIAAGLYIGLELALALRYIVFGFAFSAYGVAISMLRLLHRQSREPASPTTAPTE